MKIKINYHWNYEDSVEYECNNIKEARKVWSSYVKSRWCDIKDCISLVNVDVYIPFIL